MVPRPAARQIVASAPRAAETRVLAAPTTSAGLLFVKPCQALLVPTNSIRGAAPVQVQAVVASPAPGRASRSQGSATLGLPSARHRSQSAGAVSALQLIPEEGESSVEDSLEETRMVADVAQASEPQSAARVVGAAGSQSAPSPAALPPTRIAPLRPTETKAKRWTLSQLAELRVLSSGLRWLHQELVVKQPELEILELPKRPDGTLKVIQASFLKRLLSGALELKGCLESDVSAAHLDLRQLSLEQLLCLKVQNLDFQTSSASHVAHNNFLDSLEAHICERLTRRGLCSTASPSAQRLLGRRLLLILGAVVLLREGWGSGCRNSIPEYWAVEVDPSAWQGLKAVLFQPRTLTVQLLAGAADWAMAVGKDQLVAVVSESSAGAGCGRRFQWEIAGLDPCKDDIPAACSSSDASAKEELVKVLRARLSPRGEAMEAAIRATPRPLRAKARPPRKSLEVSAGRVRASVAQIDRGAR